MGIQSAPLPPDVEYYLDAALEYDEIDAGSHITLKLYAARADLIAIIDEVPPVGRHLDGNLVGRLTKAQRLADLANNLLAEQPPQIRSGIAWAGLMHLRSEVSRLAWHLAVWAHEDTIVGGCLEPYKRRLGKHGRAYRLSPRQERRLHSRTWIGRYIRNNLEAKQMRERGRQVLARTAGLTPDHAAIAAVEQEMSRQRAAYRRVEDNLSRFMARAIRAANGGQRRVMRRKRRVIARAAATAVTIVGQERVRAFAAGKAVVIEGERIAFAVTRAASCGSLGHGALHLEAVDKDTHARLADLCLYHSATPALDQLSALYLGVQAGEEAEIMQIANLSRVTDLGRQHPLIEQRGITEQTWEPQTIKAPANEAYWDATKPMWIERLSVFVLGHRHEKSGQSERKGKADERRYA